MSKLFGTDGIRGIAYKDITNKLVHKIGIALGYILNVQKNNNTVLIGYDTRESASMISSTITKSLINMGINIVDLGIIPTPAVSYLVKKYEADAGIMITASHNPYEYNGIKIFNKDGYKLSDELEAEIENIIKKNIKVKLSTKKGVVLNNYNPINDYIDHLINALDNKDLSGLKIVIDCANGASYKTAELLFKKLKCNITILNNQPDGYNINKNCGSTHINTLKEYVIKNKMDIGIAYDGDADRCLLIDNTGKIIDGDHILAILSNYYKYNNIVGTVMTNLGLIKYCQNNNINFISTKVGDRFVLEEIIKNNYKLGGEQSGHIILKEYANTGDGELTSLKILEIMKKSNKSLNALASIMHKYPQILINIEVNNSQKDDIINNKIIKTKIKAIEQKLGNNYRILVRPSGTEPLIRVMIEGIDKNVIEKTAPLIVNIIKENI